MRASVEWLGHLPNLPYSCSMRSFFRLVRAGPKLWRIESSEQMCPNLCALTFINTKRSIFIIIIKLIMNKSVIKTGRGIILGLDSSSSSSSRSFDDESFIVSTSRRRHPSKRPRGRGRPPKLLKNIKASTKR